jgi:hypothetical protein
MVGTLWVSPLAATPAGMLDKRARRLWLALSECRDATLDDPASHVAWPQGRSDRWKLTAFRTLTDLRLVTPYSTGWRITHSGRAVLAGYDAI